MQKCAKFACADTLIDGQKIDQVKGTVCLGVYVDENLVWNLSSRQQSV